MIVLVIDLPGYAGKDMKQYGANLSLQSGGNPFSLTAGGLSYAMGSIAEAVDMEDKEDTVEPRKTHSLDKRIK